MFDYIIAGGGSAGCVLANRLTSNTTLRVCLIEAGPPDYNPLIQLPTGTFVIFPSQILNWNYWTIPQENCGQRTMYCPRGRTLGGSSSINAMCYLRGHPNDYDEWAKLGNAGWSYADVLPYFKKMENFEGDSVNAFHGKNGPMNVDGQRYIHPLAKVFVTAGQQAGYSMNADFNGSVQDGVGYYHVAQKNGKRCSNAAAYLQTAKKRNNLTVITRAQVVKILFKGKRAIGVRYLQNRRYIEVFAKKEVILAAGAIGSPHLLLLSGVGPEEDLKKHEIPLIHHLPGVGKNLQDHLDIHITCLDKTHQAISLRPLSIFRIIAHLFRYIAGVTSLLGSNIVQAGGFIKTDHNQVQPDLQWHFLPLFFTDHGKKWKLLFKYYGFTLLTCQLKPSSCGEIILKNADPLVAPLINPNYLAEADDLKCLINGLRKAREVLAQPAFSPYKLLEVEPGDTIQTDEQIAEYIRRRAETIYHPVGTCKMGNDDMAVVDSQLRVRGLECLRVVDASIMPKIVSGNTNAPTTMIAEKAADLILSDQ